MMHRSLIRSTALVALTFSMIWSAPQTAAAATSTDSVDPNASVVTATYEGQSIDPHLASHYFCHTRDYPIVRCFASQREVDDDLGLIEPLAPGGPSVWPSGTDGSLDGASPEFPGGTAYTIAYWDINYGGSALTVYGNVWNLDPIGWNDSISSFKSVNCGVPRYYVDAGYSGVYWQNACNTWSPNLYAYNDTFSSVVNEAP
jgi:hypothetical protein